ncbi:MAG: hypothetical protein IT427_14775 [Pirellulales bacterium]|nr:hypothetical protein [Pirellulales bacterium]
MSLPAGIAERLPLQELLGYLNFSSGASDATFLKGLNELWGAIEAAGIPPQQSWQVAHQLLRAKLDELAGKAAAFKDAEQARGVLRLAFEEVLPAYAQHHRDLLFHQTGAELWRPLFVGHVMEAVLAEGAPWEESRRIVDRVLRRLNDFIGHRPVPVLETRKHEPYSHERVRPVPLYIANVGVAVGRYHDLIDTVLRILRSTDRELLEAACFDPDLLDELSFDPRAYDFNHPVNRRPNYHFGQWDPHLIDNRGQYRRFVLQQCTLDAVLARMETSRSVPREQLMFEAGAVLAGTILMAAGTSGAGPDSFDSSVTLAKLMPHIATYRDEFYRRLLARAPAEVRQHLQSECETQHQPFAGARQHLNAELARLRALQLQHVELAILFARLGYSEAAARQADIVPAASARMVCQMQCLLTSGHRLADAGRLTEAFAMLPQVDDLLSRAIQCGAVVDPWNILGFSGQFSLFPAMENSIPDPRVDELLDLVAQAFALYSRLWHEAATADDAELLDKLPPAFRQRADWWDQFATTSVEGIRSISGDEAHTSGRRVAEALAAWHQGGAAAGKVAFWQPFADEFDSPQAYGRVIEVLLDKEDLHAAMALLMHWLSQAAEVSLDEGRRSFYALAVRWMQLALGRADRSATTVNDSLLIQKFFDYLEANAEDYWDVPNWRPDDFASVSDGSRQSKPPTESDVDPEEGQGADELFSAAYEDVVYRDSTSDGTDADMLEVPAAGDHSSDDELEREQRRLSSRLAFLAMLAALWKMAAATAQAGNRKSVRVEVPRTWRERAVENRNALVELAAAIQKYPIAPTSASYEALVELDRRRMIRESLLEKVVATIVANRDAEMALAAVDLSATAEVRESESSCAVGPQTIVLWSAALRGDAPEVGRLWPAFLSEIAEQPLLYVPITRGGDARKIASVRGLQQMFRELLQRLPRLGMLRETCQLLRVAREMEKDHPLGAGAVTEFDRLFEVGYKAIVESLVESSAARHEVRPPSTAAKSKKRRSAKAQVERAAADDLQLIDGLQMATESLLGEWLSHSRTLRLSVLERVDNSKTWQALVAFIRSYGSDLFTQDFFHLGNLRGILHQGVENWLEQLAEDGEAADHLRLFAELDERLPRAEAKKHLSLVIEAVVENYTEYRDYNATTTQSDRGEMLYALLDFLRVKVGYERIHWNLRPVMMAHEVLVRRGCHGAAEQWRHAMAERTSDVAEQQIKRLADLQTEYAMRLPTIADRLSERFIRPLTIDRIRSLVAPAAEEARQGSPTTTFPLLEQEASELAHEPCGAGLDLPDWLELVAQEVDRVCNRETTWDVIPDAAAEQPWVRLSWEEIQSQLTDWDAEK